MSTPPTAHQLSTSLTSQHLPTPSQSFLNSIITPSTTLQRVAPLPALIATAKHRLLSSPLTTASLLSPNTPLLPPDISNVHIQSRTLPADIHVELLDIDDLGRSKWEQIEALESERKGETTKGREVIRVVPPGPGAETGSSSTQALSGNNNNSNANSTETATTTPGASKGPFKLLLQDYKGTQVHAFEVKRVDKIGYPPRMHIGSKILLRKGTRVARGVVLLEPGNVVVLGGRVEAPDKAWVEGRESVLRERVQREREEGGGGR